MQVRRGKVVLTLSGAYGKLTSDRLMGRLRQLARLIGRDAAIET
jgi:hypothetical protein